MNDRERLIELVKNARDAELCLCQNCFDSDECLATGYCDKSLKAEAASLIANGVTIQKHGRWIVNTDDFTPAYRCSVCCYNKPMIAGEKVSQGAMSYCPNCGAKMDLEEDNAKT